MPESDFMKAFKVANFNIVEQPIQGTRPCFRPELALGVASCVPRCRQEVCITFIEQLW